MRNIVKGLFITLISLHLIFAAALAFASFAAGLVTMPVGLGLIGFNILGGVYWTLYMDEFFEADKASDLKIKNGSSEASSGAKGDSDAK